MDPLSRVQRYAIVFFGFLVAGLAVWVSRTQPYRSGSLFGYHLGLVGGCLMLSLLLYPLRKRWNRIDALWPMRGWFSYHMVAGILGPLLILFHTAFRLNSINGQIAFWAMVMITLSGIVGRFIYLHVHVELDGHRASLQEVERYLEKRADNADHILDQIPEVRDRLQAYGKRALSPEGNKTRAWWKFLSASWEKELLIETSLQAVRKALRQQARSEGWSRSKYLAERKAMETVITDFIRAIDDAARFAAWERMLEWWHLAHLPVITVLVIAGVTHVIGVHMY